MSWRAAGVTLLKPILAFFSGGPEKLKQMAMEQAMKQVMKRAGLPAMPASGPAGANPFAAMAGAGGANPFAAMASAGDIDVVPTTPAAGVVKEAAKAEEETPIVSATPPPAAPKASTAPPPPSPGPATDPKPKRSLFEDVEPAAASTSYVAEPAVEAGAPEAATSAAPGPGSAPSASAMLDMLKDPAMQKTLYPYLPEHMRNPQTFEFMLSNPEMRSQLEGMMAQQAAAINAPEMQEMMKDVDVDKVTQQMGEMGVTPEQMMQRVMADPELAMLMTKPKVMSAMMEMNKNPMAMLKYQSDPEISKVFQKLQGMFPQAGGPRR
ncbi:hypothetical protein QBZ16_000673 [Prototheca wickerhamii]|uniref:STI1 domain-containing protein n=1 Tax=Prototheca wickerhamii TaxID=3111 RepID=A0AAD9MIY1_PROWI|nr:hypothetical protein QBZ16_000673 [Prototheca wickerhamii]